MKKLFYTLFLAFLVSCNKPDPNPELSDEIYKDYLQELDMATKNLDSEEKNLDKLKIELKSVVPQTGQIKFATKKVIETEAVISALRQQKQYFEIKIEQRKIFVREKYLLSRRGGKSWPDQDELLNYRTTIKFQREKLSWDKTKGIKKDVPRGTSDKNNVKNKNNEEHGSSEAEPAQPTH